MLWAKENLGEGEPLVFFISLFQEQLRVVLFFLFEIFLHLNTHSHTHTIMSTKLMDATPDLKRLAPVENLAIDVISYAHGSVTPTLTHLYSKGKDSFLKVRRRYFVVNGETHKNAQRGAFLFSFFLSFFLSCFCRTHERDARRVRVNLRRSVQMYSMRRSLREHAFLRGAWNLEVY